MLDEKKPLFTTEKFLSQANGESKGVLFLLEKKLLLLYMIIVVVGDAHE